MKIEFQSIVPDLFCELESVKLMNLKTKTEGNCTKTENVDENNEEKQNELKKN